MLPEIGEEGQRRLLASSALIVGLGGLGCPVGLYLTGAGVGRIGLCDPDTVSMSNLQRQTLYSEATVGMPKPLAAYERLASLSSATEFDLWPDGLTRDNACGASPGSTVRSELSRGASARSFPAPQAIPVFFPNGRCWRRFLPLREE